jgi:symplekin
MRSRNEIFDEATRKRAAPELVDGGDSAKRQRLGQNANPPTGPARLNILPLGPGKHTIAQLFTVTEDTGLKGFDVSQLSEDLVTKIGVSILSKLDSGLLNQAISVGTVLIV